METISRDKAIKILHQKKISFFDIADAKKIFGLKKEIVFISFCKG